MMVNLVMPRATAALSWPVATSRTWRSRRRPLGYVGKPPGPAGENLDGALLSRPDRDRRDAQYARSAYPEEVDDTAHPVTSSPAAWTTYSADLGRRVAGGNLTPRLLGAPALGANAEAHVGKGMHHAGGR